jgi:hypothetical protein
VIRKFSVLLAGAGLALCALATPAGAAPSVNDTVAAVVAAPQAAPDVPAEILIFRAQSDLAESLDTLAALPTSDCGPAAIAGPNAGGANLASLSGPDDPTDPPVTGGIQAHDPDNPEPDPAEA